MKMKLKTRKTISCFLLVKMSIYLLGPDATYAMERLTSSYTYEYNSIDELKKNTRINGSDKTLTLLCIFTLLKKYFKNIFEAKHKKALRLTCCFVGT